MENERESQANDARFQIKLAGMKKLVLASSSPRRAEILRIVGWPFEALTANVDESLVPGESAVAYVKRLAREKAEAVARRTSGVVLGADTVVVVGGGILGKPRDEADARRMLRLLSAKWHEVLTGVALVRAGAPPEHVGAYERTRVRFAPMSDDEINWYVATGEPADKAGAYAVQGRAALFIEAIEGDYWNVVGLPVQLVYKLAQSLSG